MTGAEHQAGPDEQRLDFSAFVRAVADSRYQWVRREDAIDMAIQGAGWLTLWTGVQFEVDGEPIPQGRSLGRMREFVRNLGVLDDEPELTMPRPVAAPC